MKSRIILFLGFILMALVMSSCDRNDPRVFKQIIYVRFINSVGENLVEKYGIKIDSTDIRPIKYFLKDEEYFLTHKINGVEASPELQLEYNEHGDADGFEGRISFESGVSNDYLRNERKPFTYEYNFVCPKIFGDNEPRKIEAVWGTRKKTSYNKLLEVRFNGEIVPHEDERDPCVIIVLK